jgi:cation diffusion facilitator family transporter
MHQHPTTQRVATTSLLAAALLVALTLGTGLVVGSLGLVSAGVESSGDIIAAVLTLFALKISKRPADSNHNYGHLRAENLAALGEATILAAGGLVVVVEAIARLVGAPATLSPHWYVFAVIGVVIGVDGIRAFSTLRAASTHHSTALHANAIHFAGDVMGALAVLVGLIAVSEGWHQGDAVAALIVAGIIFMAAFRLISENARVLMDTVPAGAQAQAYAAIVALPGIDLRRLRLRESGGRYFGEAVVSVLPGQAIVMGHTLADEIEEAVRRVLPGSDIVVHLEPQTENLAVRDRVLALALSEPLVREAHDITLYEQGERVSLSLHLKMAAETSLEEAHEVAERVEAALRLEQEIASVHTHLEPLEQPLAATDKFDASDVAEKERISELVWAHTQALPRELFLLDTDVGCVVFVTVAVGHTMSLTNAHALAGRLEDDIRRGQSQIADVVVHTEP